MAAPAQSRYRSHGESGEGLYVSQHFTFPLDKTFDPKRLKPEVVKTIEKMHTTYEFHNKHAKEIAREMPNLPPGEMTDLLKEFQKNSKIMADKLDAATIHFSCITDFEKAEELTRLAIQESSPSPQEPYERKGKAEPSSPKAYLPLGSDFDEGSEEIQPVPERAPSPVRTYTPLGSDGLEGSEEIQPAPGIGITKFSEVIAKQQAEKPISDKVVTVVSTAVVAPDG